VHVPLHWSKLEYVAWEYCKETEHKFQSLYYVQIALNNKYSLMLANICIQPTNKIWNCDCFLIVPYHPALNKQIHRYKKYTTTCILSIASISTTMMNLNNTLRQEPW